MDKLEFHGEIENFTQRQCETFSVDVMEGYRGRPLIRLAFETDQEDPIGPTWVADVCLDNARRLAHLLLNATGTAESACDQATADATAPRRLPTIWLCGTEFYIDQRLKQLRNVANPMHYFNLQDPGLSRGGPPDWLKA